ncbi:MAG: DUF397 domain-containing protein [Pseudonocardiaceae bacterium]
MVVVLDGRRLHRGRACAAGVLVRDSKDPTGGVLAVTSTVWRTFLATVSH